MAMVVKAKPLGNDPTETSFAVYVLGGWNCAVLHELELPEMDDANAKTDVVAVVVDDGWNQSIYDPDAEI